MKLLLDTQAFIWWDNEPEKLSQSARAQCEDVNNALMLSIASLWEMQIKLQLGKLRLKKPLAVLIADQQRQCGLQLLSVELSHVLELENLPAVHKDPFDRMLAAQARVEAMSLVSSDSIFGQYPVSVLW
jgi:PIN domain nuclease of toxin-antitoxin system